MYPHVQDLDRSARGETDSAVHAALRGYEIAVVIVCFLIVAALFMCYLTWKCRYKIVLRTVRKFIVLAKIFLVFVK